MENCPTPEVRLQMIVREGRRFVFPNGYQYINTFTECADMCGCNGNS